MGNSGRPSPWGVLGAPEEPWEESVGQTPLGCEAQLGSDHSPGVMQSGSMQGTGSLRPWSLWTGVQQQTLWMGTPSHTHTPTPWAQGV